MTDLETAMRRAAENAADRTGCPDRIIVYLGDGRWETPYGRCDAPADATAEEVLNRARTTQDVIDDGE